MKIFFMSADKLFIEVNEGSISVREIDRLRFDHAELLRMMAKYPPSKYEIVKETYGWIVKEKPSTS